MAKCPTCHRERMVCICPKGLGSGSSSAFAEDRAYGEKVDQIAEAIAARYSAIYTHDRSKLPDFIESIQHILNDEESSKSIIDLLKKGIFLDSDVTVFKEAFKKLTTNRAMLVALSDKFNLEIFPNPANQLVTGIKTALRVLGNYAPYPENIGNSFQQALQSYATYYNECSPEQQQSLNDIFWEQIKTLGTPIIESNTENPAECEVYFLLRKDKISESDATPGTKKDLYLQGDFHGYDFTTERQRVEELGNTGIMLKQNRMPMDAIVTYRFVQIEPAFRDLSATQIHGSDKVELPPDHYFPKGSEVEKEKSVVLPMVSEQLSYDLSKIFQQADADIMDNNTRHRPPYFEFNGAERIFKVNPDPTQAMLEGRQVNWPALLSPPAPDSPHKHFQHHRTLYSMLDGHLEFADSHRRANAGPMEFYPPNQTSSDEAFPYANCTRAIHVFTPTSGQIDHVVIINDGAGYLSLDAMRTFEAMVEEGDLSKNTAFVCITQLPALLKTMPQDDSRASMPGMGSRMVDYEHRIDDYVQFIEQSLLPKLESTGLDLPKDPNHRMMIGSSLSGTASLYIGSTYPYLIGNVIAQSPSPCNRKILKDTVDNFEPSTPRAHIHLSCGLFEQPGFAENTNLLFAHELSERLGIPLSIEAHGHQFLAWRDDLKHALPAVLEHSHTLDLTRHTPFS